MKCLKSFPSLIVGACLLLLLSVGCGVPATPSPVQPTAMLTPTASGGAAQLKLPNGDVQSISKDFVIPISPPVISDYLSTAKIISFEDMSSINEEAWDSVHATVEKGVVRFTKAGEDNPFFSSLHPFKQGEAALILIKFKKTAQFEVGMQRGEWDTAAFKRWGLYKFENFVGNVWIGSTPLEPQGMFSGTIAPVPGRWYYILYIVGKDRGTQYIWEKDNPSYTGEYSYKFGTDWIDQTWSFVIQIFEGELEIDEFAILAGEFGEQIAGSDTTSPVTPAVTKEPVEPQTTATTIFHNGQVLTMKADSPIEQAIAVKEDRILVVGNNEQVLALAGTETRIVDLAGRTLMPGFIDPHTHIFDSGVEVTGLSIRDAQQFAIENGVTSIAGFMNEDQWKTMENMNADGSLRIRTNVYLYATGACGEPNGTWYKQFKPSRKFGEMLRINGIKIFADGGTCEYPAVSQETHPGAGQGNLWFTEQQMNDMVMEAHKANYQVVIHALGDRAVRQAQNAIINANGGLENLLRHRIEHNYYLSDDLLPRYQENGILPVVFGQFPTCAVVTGLDRTDYWRATVARWRELLDANPGLPVAAKSDTPYVGQEIPLLSIYSLTTRREVADDGSICMPPDWLAERRITTEDTLPMLTINSAYVLFRENEIGSLEIGKLADLIILSGNPLETAPEDLVNLEVWMTMIGGKTEYCAMEHHELCP